MATLSIRVAAGADDSFYRQDSSATPVMTLSNNANDVPVGLFGSTQTAMGGQMRFLNVTIPQGATINSATVTFVSSGADSATTVNSKFRGKAVDNATMDTTTAGFISPPFTTAVVNWDGIGAWSNGGTFTSPDLSTIVQEIVSRAGWASGNALIIQWDDLDKRSTQVANTLRRGQSYDNVPANAPLLFVDYSAAGGGTVPSRLALTGVG